MHLLNKIFKNPHYHSPNLFLLTWLTQTVVVTPMQFLLLRNRRAQYGLGIVPLCSLYVLWKQTTE